MKKPDMARFRRRVKEAREGAGLTVEQAAEAADVSVKLWTYLEWNRRTPLPVPAMRQILAAVGLGDETLRECGLL